jgi:NAD(P)-dependent dehydrogenase (short-subunit alcohol dehydrogenase family)
LACWRQQTEESPRVVNFVGYVRTFRSSAVPATTPARPIALITGASSGIGEALTHNFADYGHDLVLVARSADKLKMLAAALEAEHGIKVLVLPVDLSLPGAAETLTATLKRRRKVPDVLVNSAGVLEQKQFAKMKPAGHQAIIDLNISALTAMLAHLLPLMGRAARGACSTWRPSRRFNRFRCLPPMPRARRMCCRSPNRYPKS